MSALTLSLSCSSISNFTHGHWMWQQSHLTIQKDRPDESDVQQNIQYFIENERAENRRPNHVSDDVVLMSSRFV